MSSHEKITMITNIILSGLTMALFFHSALHFVGFDYPYSSFLFDAGDRFMDFFNVYEIDKNLDPYFSGLSQFADYFPFCYLIFFPFTLLPAKIAFFIFTFLFCAFLYLFILNFLKKVPFQKSQNIHLYVLAFLISYPVIFCIDRANVDNIVFILAALCISNFIQKKYYTSSIWLALAASMKLYPFVFLVLFLKEKRWKEIFFCLLLSFILTLTALSLFKTPGIIANLHQFSLILSKINLIYVVNDHSLFFSSSLFSLIKIVIWYSPMFDHQVSHIAAYQQTIKTIQPYYFYFSIITFILVTLHITFIEKILWKRIMLLVLPMILLPYISGDYKLIFLFIPLFLFITTPEKSLLDGFYAITLALLLIPKNYLIVTGPTFNVAPDFSMYSSMELINVALMIIIFISIIHEGIKLHLTRANSICQS